MNENPLITNIIRQKEALLNINSSDIMEGIERGYDKKMSSLKKLVLGKLDSDALDSYYSFERLYPSLSGRLLYGLSKEKEITKETLFSQMKDLIKEL